MLERGFEGFEPTADDPTDVIQSIADLGKSMALEVSGEDVKELVDKHSEDLATEELKGNTEHLRVKSDFLSQTFSSLPPHVLVTCSKLGGPLLLQNGTLI
ncbi:hypothetical protein AVEN_120869-1 [Araneus ventricosus]|uniref:Uncharacterized protein n=1 Tax=Araneus ventricosus TaxID=182803 RepID=A0A4Y2K213_ARAVE|nr:hypothetical protein AVEN_120869-1 [Araneus ventricosus]